MDVASDLQCHGVTDLLDREGRGDRQSELAGRDCVGAPLHGARARVDGAGRAHGAGRVGPCGDGGDPLGPDAQRERGLGRFGAEKVGSSGHAGGREGLYPVRQAPAHMPRVVK